MSVSWCSTSAAALLSLLLAVIALSINDLQPRQELLLKSFSECDERGTDELRFAVKGHNGLYSGSIIFKRPLDNTVQAVAEISRWMDHTNEWGRTFHVHRIPDACNGILGLVPSFGKSISDCMGIAGGCPIATGEYNVENCELSLGNVTRRLPVGEFRLTVSLRNTTHVLGRFCMVVEVTCCKSA